MYFLICWRARRLTRRGDERVRQTRSLLDTRGVEIRPRDQSLIEERLQQ
jgi:hypothetical protein